MLIILYVNMFVQLFDINNKFHSGDLYISVTLNRKLVYNSRNCSIPGIKKKQGRYTMNKAETDRFHELYQRHLRLLKLQAKSQKTIDMFISGSKDFSELDWTYAS